MAPALRQANRLTAAESRGALYALLSYGWAYPTPEVLETMTTAAGWFGGAIFLSTVARETDGVVRGALDWIQTFGRTHHIGPQEIRDRYVALFGHAVRGQCPPYELEYGRSEIIQQANELADIAGFYSAFGLEPEHTAAERLDHVTIECEFLAVLCAKEAVGLQSDSSRLVETAQGAQRAFLKDHLGRWLPSFCRRVVSADGDGPYGPLARLSASLIEAECHCLDIAAGSPYLELRPADPEADATIDCDGSREEDRLVPLTVNGAACAAAG